MRQQTLAGTGFERHRKMTRRERFLQEMDRIVPWQHLVDVVAPYYPSGERGRPPVGLERMLRVYCLGHWYNLSDQGVQVSGGTIVDATIIDAPSSTKHQRGERDPEMHQTKKGNQWYFGMKGDFGVDSRSKLIHAVVVTAANTADGSVVGDLLHGEETRVWGDKAYDGQREVIAAAAAPAAQNHTHDKGHRHLTNHSSNSRR